MISQDDIQAMFDLEETMDLKLGSMTLWDLLKRYRMFDHHEIREQKDPNVEQHLTELEVAIETILQAFSWDFSFDDFYKTLCQTPTVTALNKGLIESMREES